MIKEYCDKCGAEIQVGKQTVEDGIKSRAETRFRIVVWAASEPDPVEAETQVSSDVLCPGCAQKWRFVND